MVFFMKTHILSKSFVISASLLIFGCSSTPSTPSTPTAWHNIAGTSVGWNAKDVTVLSDIVVSDLQVRHVRRKSADCTAGYFEHIELNGTIGPDSTYIVQRLLDKVETCVDVNTEVKYSTTVYMNSKGGLLKDGYLLGDMLRKYNTYTRLRGRQVCASACAVAFLGGKFRQLSTNSQLLFHAPYIRNEYNQILCASRRDSAQLRAYYISMLSQEAGARVFDRTMDYCSSSSGWTVNKDAADIFHITS